ncbi:MAG: hypothetical protein M9921_12395 [Fimbriimonadaceae bacterium]|nr:hypothetical protein [Fimbriimonadaceae bacterium]
MPVLAALILLALAPTQAPWVFRSDGGSITLDSQARCINLVSTGGLSFHDGAKVPMASAWIDGSWHDATTLTQAGDHLLVTFGGQPFKMLVDIVSHPEGIAFTIADVQGPTPEKVRFAQISTRDLDRRGTILNCRWNNVVAVSLLGLGERVEAAPWGGHGLGVTAYRQFGIKGEGALLVIAPTATMRQAVRRAELAWSLPSPKLDGQWAKESAAANDSYLFTDLTESNADETIRLAKLGGFKAILVYGSTWSASAGTYPINLRNYPGGEDSLRRVTDKCHAAGLRVGMHLVTSMISKYDALATPAPDPRLLADARGTLAAAIGPSDTTLVLQAAMADFPREGAFYGNVKGGRDVMVGSEIIRYQSVDEAGGKLVGCQRGVGGTRAASHPQGAVVEHLAERYGSYLADLQTDLLGQMADRISGLLDRCGFDMVYFDGGENASANGPYWYWVGRVQSEVLKRVKRPLLVQGSGLTHWLWHWFTRGTCDDYAALAPDTYLDRHKIADSYRRYEDNFLPAELGWWGLLASAPQWRATLPTDVDAYGARMLALDAPVSLETTLAALKANVRSEELLARLDQWESLRKSGHLDSALRKVLAAGDWTLDSAGQPSPVHTVAFDADTNADVSLGTIRGAPKSLRIECLPALSQPKAAAGDGTLLPVPAGGQPMPGWMAQVTRFDAGSPGPTPFFVGPTRTDGARGGIDLTARRTLAVSLDATGATGADLGVLNIQLESPGKLFRDYFVDVRPGRTTTIVDFLDSAPRLLDDFRPAPTNYAFKAALYAFDFAHVLAVNVRWMRAPAPGSQVRLVAVEPLVERSAALVNPTLVCGGQRVNMPATVATGESIEIDAQGQGRVFAADGAERARFKTPPLPAFQSSQVRLVAASGGRARICLTFPHPLGPVPGG